MSLERVKAALLKSYEEYGGINHIDGRNLPSEESINRLCSDLMHLLFPGFFEQKPLRKSELPAQIGERLQDLVTRLQAEIEKALSFAGEAAPATRAEAVAMELLGQLPELRRIIQTDVEAAYLGDPAAKGTDEIILAYPCVLVISLQRIAHVLYRSNVPLIPRMITEFAHERTGTDIHPGAEIGTHFFIDHCTGVVIGETTRIGNHVKIYQGVTLGAKSFELDEAGNPVKGVKRHPDIGDHVTIYPGATILGGNTCVGENSVVGSHVWLMKSVPANTVVYYQGDLTSVIRRKGSSAKAVAPVDADADTSWMI